MKKDQHSIVPSACVIVRRDREILLIRRVNKAYMGGFYSVPAGHIKPWETPRLAACREAKEEVGIDLLTDQLVPKVVVVRIAHEKDHERVTFYFEASSWQGVPANCEPEVCDDVQWFEIDKLPANTEPQLLKVLQCIKQGETYLEFDYE